MFASPFDGVWIVAIAIGLITLEVTRLQHLFKLVGETAAAFLFPLRREREIVANLGQKTASDRAPSSPSSFHVCTEE